MELLKVPSKEKRPLFIQIGGMKAILNPTITLLSYTLLSNNSEKYIRNYLNSQIRGVHIFISYIFFLPWRII